MKDFFIVLKICVSNPTVFSSIDRKEHSHEKLSKVQKTIFYAAS